MRAVRAERFGGPEVLVAGEVPDPVAGPGQVVVGVRAADVLFLDAQVRRGLFGEHFAVRPPYVPGGAVVGRVLSVGAGVDPGWTGRRVAARTGVRGGYAEQAVVPAGELVPVPDALDLDAAAALLHDGPTALALSGNARVGPGARVLVLAAAGGRRRGGGRGVRRRRRGDRPGGVRGDGARRQVLRTRRPRRLMERALAEAAAGRIRPLAGQTFPLERAADAHAVMEARGAVGKTLLLP
ncbi:alcohol dehydrogenase catalytic domain-containing protein [Streptomyces thermolineatus]|uniref:alcohol dehydrogenase catalytic domain-containing protein n=1 Tax=Streptomyces thermolineatus TaxID=44033 RepID=UPI0031DFE332